jgi:hypothetical protein
MNDEVQTMQDGEFFRIIKSLSHEQRKAVHEALLTLAQKPMGITRRVVMNSDGSATIEYLQ